MSAFNGLYSLLSNGSAVRQVLQASAVINIASVAAAGTVTNTVAVPGALPGDLVVLGLPATVDAGIVFDARVSAADTVTLRAQNITAGAIDPASATYTFLVFKV
jgi:hypothetical protein